MGLKKRKKTKKKKKEKKRKSLIFNEAIRPTGRKRRVVVSPISSNRAHRDEIERGIDRFISFVSPFVTLA